jgi:CRP-like cAMP-binding protein
MAVMIKQVLSNIGRFSAEELNLIQEQCLNRRLKKNEILLESGQVCRSVYFILEGAFYQYRMNDIDENIIELHIENEWFLNYESFLSQKPSTETIKAYADSEILELTVHSIHALIEKSPVFFQLGKLLQPLAVRSKFFDEAMTPAEKYNYVMDHRPRLLQRFPLKYIASYLKITPETLSRVRSIY